MKYRSNELEWIDLGEKFYSQKEYQECLYQLSRIGKIIGGDRATFSAFKRLSFKPEKILDVGCGGGYFAFELAKKYPTSQITGIEMNPQAVQIATDNLKTFSFNNVTFQHQKDKTLPFEDNFFDVVTATLVCHHLVEDELPLFFKECMRVAKKAVIFNDLHRHFLAYFSFCFLSPFLFSNRLIQHDGPISVKRAFKKQDWEKVLKKLDISQASIKWKFPFRWVVTIEVSDA